VRLSFCRDCLLLLHPVVAIGYAVLRLGVGFAAGGTGPPSHLDDLLFRRALRACDALKFDLRGVPCSVPLGFAGGVVLQVTFLATCVCLAALAVVLIRAFATAKISRAILHPSVAFAGLLGWLACWWRVGVALPTGGWLWSEHFPGVVWHAWLFLGCTAIIGYLAAGRKRITYLAAFAYGSFFLLHFGFWSVTLTDRVLWLAPVLVTAGVAARGLVWLSRGKEVKGDDMQPGSGQVGRGFALVCALVSLGVLLAIWLPARTHSIAQSVGVGSLIIRLERGGGFGGAPAYSITIHGDGKVAYVGQRRVAVKGTRTASMGPDQIRRLVERLDRIDFLGLDSRTFARCPDAPIAAIALSVDGTRNTAVAFDCPAFDTEPETEVLKAAQEIDSALGSDQWTRCDGDCPW